MRKEQDHSWVRLAVTPDADKLPTQYESTEAKIQLINCTTQLLGGAYAPIISVIDNVLDVFSMCTFALIGKTVSHDVHRGMGWKTLSAHIQKECTEHAVLGIPPAFRIPSGRTSGDPAEQVEFNLMDMNDFSEGPCGYLTINLNPGGIYHRRVAMRTNHMTF